MIRGSRTWFLKELTFDSELPFVWDMKRTCYVVCFFNCEAQCYICNHQVNFVAGH